MPVSARLRPAAIAFFASVALAAGQTRAEDSHDILVGLQTQLQQLQVALTDMRAELADARRDSQELRRDIAALREQLAADALGPASKVEARVSVIAEGQQVNDAKLREQDQTKVASGSRYHVRLSGMALLSATNTRGAVDQMDVPSLAQPRDPGSSNGSFGATVRQSQVSLEVFGPEWRGAKTSGDVSFDFSGGFPAARDGLSAGLLRLRTARFGLEWKNTSIVAGQEAPFFAPLSPTSLASAAYPVFTNAGNLWTWTPQLMVERRFAWSDRSTFSVEGGILDPLTGELPASEYERMPTAGEQSRTPAYAMRLGWKRSAYDDFASFGGGVYYSRQDWRFGRHADAWAATGDWDTPLGPRFRLSGEVYRGRAIGGLGAGENGSVLFIGEAGLADTTVLPLDSMGGWAQLKFKATPKMELNAAFGEDFAFLSGRQIPTGVADLVRRNVGGMFNVIFQPRSNLLFSVEYKRLRTVRISPVTADHVSVAAGILF
jgi:hypothetical protein